MDKTKLKRQLKKFEEHLIVDRGLAKVTASGYCRALSIALRRMRKFVPRHTHIRDHILWMRKKDYSYSHLVNTSLALEHFTHFKGRPIKLGRPKKPKQLIKDILSESEVSRLIQSTKNCRERAIVCVLAYSGIRNMELCNLKVHDADLGGNKLTIVGGKNRKDRVVNISAAVRNALRA